MRPEIGRNPTELGSIEDFDVKAKLPLSPRLADEKIKLCLSFSDHKPAGEPQIEIGVELSFELLPEAHGFGVEVKGALQRWRLLRVAPEEPALHLDMQASSVGGRAAEIPRIDDRDIMAFAREEECEAEPG